MAECLAEGDYIGFRAGIDGVAGDGSEGSEGGDVEYFAAALVGHLLAELLAEDSDGADINLDHGVDIGGRLIEKRAVVAEAGVVDEVGDVEIAGGEVFH